MVSIVTVNYNTRKITEECINSVYETVKVPFEMIVVDNSNDKTEKIHPTRKGMTVLHCANRGFGHACNLGIHKSAGEYVLLLNSDTILHKHAVDRLARYLDEHSDVGAVGGKTLLKDGTLDHSCKRGMPTPFASLCYFLRLDRLFPNNPVIARYHMKYLNENEENYVEVLSGAFMLVRKSVLNKIHGFDERFFLYGEDVDLCYRISEDGWRLVYLPDAAITHFKGQSGLHTKNPKVLYNFYNSMWLFYSKDLSRHNPFEDCAVFTAISGLFFISGLKLLIGGKKNG